MAMRLALPLLMLCEPAGASTPHILTDTPSWLRLRPVLTDFFAADMDAPVVAPAATSNLSSACGGCSSRGWCGSDARCACNAGYSGPHCEYAGPAWTATPQPGLVPKSRAHHSLTAADDGRLYLFGGATYMYGTPSRLNDLHYYTPSTHRWTTPYASGHWPAHRSGHTGAFVRGSLGPRIVIFGGIDGTGAYTSTLDIYAVDEQRWSRPAVGRAPPPRARHAAVGLSGGGLAAMWLFGGGSAPAPVACG